MHPLILALALLGGGNSGANHTGADTLSLRDKAVAISNVMRHRLAYIPDSARVDVCSIHRAFPRGVDFRELLPPEQGRGIESTERRLCDDPIAHSRSLPPRHWHLHRVEQIDGRVRVTIRVDDIGESHDEDYMMRPRGPVYEVRIYNWVFD
jgi:hypothetical protein